MGEKTSVGYFVKSVPSTGDLGSDSTLIVYGINKGFI